MLHPSIAEKYKLKEGRSNVIHISRVGMRDLSVTPLSAIAHHLEKIDVLELKTIQPPDLAATAEPAATLEESNQATTEPKTAKKKN